jgi:hypothetical protein
MDGSRAQAALDEAKKTSKALRDWRSTILLQALIQTLTQSKEYKVGVKIAFGVEH